MQPYRALGWWQWMYRVSPFTYFIEGLLGQGRFSALYIMRIMLILSSAIGGKDINCAQHEFVPITPPSGLSCGDYMYNFMSTAGGYLADPAATEICLFCPYRTTDQYMYAGFNITYSHHWRDLGIMLGITAFNVSLDYHRLFLSSSFTMSRSLQFSRSHTSAAFAKETLLLACS